MTILEEIILEETSKKTYYAVISSKTWGSIWGSFVTGGIAWGMINRSTSAVVSPTLKEAVIRWIKHNNFIKNVTVSGNTIVVDEDWWDREKNTEIILLQAPEKSTFKGVFSDRNVSGPYTQHGGVIIGGGAVVPKATKENFAKVTGIKSSTMTIESVIKKADLKIKTGDTGIDVTGPTNAFKKFNGWESADFDLFEEDSSFDLEKDYVVFVEGVNKNIRKAEAKAGVKLTPEEFEELKAKAEKLKQSPKFGYYKDNNMGNVPKKASKHFIKREIYNKSSNPEIQAKGKRNSEKYEKDKETIKIADDENNFKTDMRGNKKEVNEKELERLKQEKKTIDKNKPLGQSAKKFLKGAIKQVKNNIKTNIEKGGRHLGKKLQSINQNLRFNLEPDGVLY